VSEVFAHQIARGGPLTITDPAARHYFLTLNEVGDLLLFASMHLGPSSLLVQAFPTNFDIAELAHFIVRQLTPGRDIPVHFTGLFPGDRLIKRLWSPASRRYSSPSLYGIPNRPSWINALSPGGQMCKLSTRLESATLCASVLPTSSPGRRMVEMNLQCISSALAGPSEGILAMLEGNGSDLPRRLHDEVV
jgi:FlaA1/EpsC-like NDP-sugar epimerase